MLLSATGLAACGGGGDEPISPEKVQPSVYSSATSGDALSAPFHRPPEGVRDVGPSLRKSSARLLSPQPLSVSLPPLPAEKTAVSLPEPGQAQQVGVAREVPATQSKSLPEQLNWQNTTHGGHVASISITSTGAQGVRLGVLVEALPGSARLRVYASDKPSEVIDISGHEVLQLLSLNHEAGDLSEDGRTWWTPSVAGPEVTLELELPRGTPIHAVKLAIPRLSHIYADDVTMALAQKNGASASCHVDAVCRAETSDLADAVARMIFVKNGSSYVCSGTLVNDKDPNSYTPYFISAAHCIASQTVASTLNTDFFYRSSACNSRTTSSSTKRLTGGAQMLYVNTNIDTVFMRLNDAAPAGASFAGWTTNLSQGASVMGLHHPAGDWLKASFGTVAGQATCMVSGSDGGFSCTWREGSSGNYHRVPWRQGITEGGSSGSGLFNSDNQILGVLRGGDSSCSSLGFGVYGRFDIAFNEALSQWLNTAPSTPAPAPAPTPPVVTPTPSPSPSAPRSAVYRFYNPTSGAHFYSGSAAERDFVIARLPDFQYEGVAFYALAQASAGMDPVFRFYNSSTGAHFYSISAAERDFVRRELPAFAYEGPSWYARATAVAGTVPVYRFYNGTSGAHFYTSSAQERDFVINSLREFQYESVAYHVWRTQ